MKKIIATLIAIILLWNFGFSQDIIKLKTGLEIRAKVLEVGKKEIKYQKDSTLNGGEQVINKIEIDRIVFENGITDVFYKNMTTDEYRALCKRKIYQYENKSKNSLVLGAIGGTSLAVLGAFHNGYMHNYDGTGLELVHPINAYFFYNKKV